MRVSEGYLRNLALDWQRAYVDAHGKDAPSIQWRSGWFIINDRLGISRYRRTTVEGMRDLLRRQAEKKGK